MNFHLRTKHEAGQSWLADLGFLVLGLTLVASSIAMWAWQVTRYPKLDSNENIPVPDISHVIQGHVPMNGSPDVPLENGPPAIMWNSGTTAYRAIHFIAKWNTKSSTWEPISPDLTLAHVQGSDGYGVDGITAVAQMGKCWYIGTLTGHVIISSNGRTWTTGNAGMPARTVTAIAIDPASKQGDVAALGFGGYGTATPQTPGHVYLTTDAGQSWANISYNLPDSPVVSLHFITDNGKTTLLANMHQTWFAFNNKNHWQRFSRQ